MNLRSSYVVKIQKAHKILLDISPEIERQFVSWCGAARWSYNCDLRQYG